MPHDPLGWINDELEQLSAARLRRRLVVRETRQAPQLQIAGRELINFGSNDYLGLAAACLNEAVLASVHDAGWGSGASPLIAGRGRWQAELEWQLARFEGTAAALLFSSGFGANVGAVTSLVGKQDAVFSDAKNHASIIDGCRLSGAAISVYAHADVDDLRRLLAAAGGARRRLIVSDGLFSMDGDLAPLADLAELAEAYDAMLMVDEAHATGVFGAEGRGVAEHLGVEAGVHVRVGTLSKALGSIGGFVAGPQSLIDWVSNRARSYVFSTAPPDVTAAAAIEALRIVRDEPHRRRQLLATAAALRQRLVEQGWDVGASASQIVPLVIGQEEATMRLAAALREQGLFVPGIRPPSVPAGQSLLRVSLSYAHTPAMIERLLAALAELRA